MTSVIHATVIQSRPTQFRRALHIRQGCIQTGYLSKFLFHGLGLLSLLVC